MRGRRGVDVAIEITRFNSLTPVARRDLQDTGVHDIIMFVRVTDDLTGEVLVPRTEVRADLAAFSGEQARIVDERGWTPKLRISQHLTRVFQGWLGFGPDNRTTFQRVGL